MTHNKAFQWTDSPRFARLAAAERQRWAAGIMRVRSNQTVLGLILAVGCSDLPSDTMVRVKGNRLVEATVTDRDGIRSISGLQRIPSGTGFHEYSVDFRFDQPGAKTYDISIGGMFDVTGTVVHLDVIDMNGNEAFLFIRSTPQGHQIGTYKQR